MPNELDSLFTQKSALIAWKDRLASTIPTGDGRFVIGSFPSVYAANNMRDSYLMIKDINNKLIEHFTLAFQSDPSDTNAADEAVYLSAQNATLDRKLADIEQLVASMESLY